MVVTMQFIKAGRDKAWTMLFGTDNNEHILLGERGTASSWQASHSIPICLEQIIKG